MLAGAVILAVAIAAAPTDAPPRSLHVETRGDAPAGCVTATRVHASVADTLALPLPDDARDPAARIDVEVRRATPGLDARIEVRTRTGAAARRSLRIERHDCGELESAIVLVAALMLDELWTQQRMLVVPRRRWAAFVGIGGLVSAGDLGRVSGGLAVTTEFAAPRVVSLAVGAWAWPATRVAPTSDRGGRFSAYEGALALCPRLHDGIRLQAGMCAGARVGATRASGIGLELAHTSVRPRVLLDTNAFVRVRLVGPLWLRVALGVATPLVRDRYSYALDGDRVLVQRAWPVVPVAQLGLEFRSELRRRRDIH